jgi:hypothetical protein
MPLHNAPYNKFNQENHAKEDGVVEFGILNNIGFIQRKMYGIQIKDENDLAREIARIANISRQLAYMMEVRGKGMSQDEAYQQLVHSASLFKAVLAYVKGAE